MDRITLHLQDKEVIEALANDPNMSVRIKDAIVDGIGKRAIKLMNSHTEIKSAVRSVSSAIVTNIRNEFLEGYYGQSLNKTYKGMLIDSCKKELPAIMKECLKEYVNEQLDEVSKIVSFNIGQWKETIEERMNKYDFDKAFERAVSLEVKRRFDNMSKA